MEGNKAISCELIKDTVCIARHGIFQYGIRLGRRQDDVVVALRKNPGTDGWERITRPTSLKGIRDGVRKGTVTFMHSINGPPPIVEGQYLQTRKADA